jgi:hypothetical protein
MNARSRLTPSISIAVAAVAFVGGALVGLPGARASATRVYTLRAGDRVLVPAIDQTCVLSGEGGRPDLFCARTAKPRHEVTIFRDSILVWRVGNPDHPAWSGKP